MKCPFCKNSHTKVQDTRKYDSHVHRVRYCPVCLRGFETDEQIDKDVFEVKEVAHADAGQSC